MIWFTSDTHWGHKNIIKYCNRPFDYSSDGLQQMDETLVRNWNERVAPDDTVWHLGDFCMGEKKAASYFHRLNGNKHLIWGNHDPDLVKYELPWVSSSAYEEIRVDGAFIVLCHYKFTVFNRSHHGAIQLYGHSHANLPGNNQQIDVGVDNFDFRPVNLNEIKDRLRALPPFQAVDHHGRP